MDNLFAIIMAVAAGVMMTLLGMGRLRGKKKEPGEPPDNTAADAARGSIQRTFEEEIGAVKRDLESDDPAGDLAARGNARRRS